jgi:hypothetical protein
MKIGLVDVDGHNFPNLCLMKLSAWHKAKGDEVEFAIPLMQYDRIYMARVFDDLYTHDDLTAYQCDEIIKGGTGYGLEKKLPNEIEQMFPDYSLYGITDTAYGFLTRGCPRHCPFCIVGDKEGLVSRKVANLSQFWNGQKNIKLLDPNILASADHMDLLEQLANSKALVDFTQGLDARMLTDENIDVLKRIRIKRIHFAWDNPKDKTVPNALEMFSEKYGLNPKAHNVVVYLLTNYWSTHQQDLERVQWLREHFFVPYVMIYNKPSAPRETRLLQRWVNNKIVFNKVKTFDEFDSKKA